MAKSIGLFFSGASNLGIPQGDANMSLGGYPSNTPIPKNLNNSLFSEISIYDLKSKQTDTLAIFLKNTGDEELTSITLKQIYDEILGELDMYCKFEWAITEPNSEGFIELIGSKKETPYYAEFFEPIFRRQDATMEILTPGAIDDAIQILGEDITLTGNSIDTLIEDIVLFFKNSTLYDVNKKSSTSVHFKKKEDDFGSELVDILTPGTASSTPTNFGGGVDNTFELLSDPLEVNGYLGLWIRRSYLDGVDTCKDLTDSSKKENLEVEFEF